MSRTPPAKAFEVLALHLNFHAGSTLSINEVVKATGLAWGTVRKYATIMALLRKLAPDMDVSDDGINVKEPAQAATATLEDPLDATVLYTFTHARKAGRPTSWVNLANHEHLPVNLDLTQAELLEMIELDGDSVRLSPAGLAHANHLYRGLVQHVPEVLEVANEPAPRQVFVDDAVGPQHVYVGMGAVGSGFFGSAGAAFAAPSGAHWRPAPRHTTADYKVIR